MPREPALATKTAHSGPHRVGVQALGYRAGEVIAGKYELVRLLGSGGMGAVWAVRNLLIDAEFALKMVRNDGGEANAAERMLREARSAAKIEHPAIIRIFDFGITERGDPFLVMELLAGTTVKDILANDGPIAPIAAVRLLLPVADALSVAHTRGVVHRDVKPDNIMIVPDGSGRTMPTLVDFGIAKQLGGGVERLTLDGTVIGSPEYMSPEQAQGRPDIDHQTDVWSLSVVLYEMLTCRTPFYREEGVAAVLRAITDEAPPPLSELGVHEPELEAIVMRGLSKFRNGRFPDMRELGVALARWALSKGVEEDASAQLIRTVWFGTAASAPPVSLSARPGARDDSPLAPRRREVGWTAALVVAILAGVSTAGAGAYYWKQFRPPPLATGEEAPGVAYAPPALRTDFVPAATSPATSPATSSAPPPAPPSATPPATVAVTPAAPPLPEPVRPKATPPAPPRENGRRARSPAPSEPRFGDGPVPDGVDMRDLAPPSASAAAGAEAAVAPKPDAGAAAPLPPPRVAPPKNDLREPYPTDNPY